jgi:DNA-binding transcriptional LysR family regulator
VNWDDLKLFLAVSRCGTMSGAAKQLNVQHSTVSRRVRTLEKKLGVELIIRVKGVYELTKAGRQITSTAVRIESEVLGIDGTFLNKDDPLTGKLRVTAISSMASTILMPIFSSFSKTYPQIDLHIMVSNETASLANREADIAIRLTNSPSESLVGKRLVTLVSTVYGSTEYLSHHRKKKDKLKWIGANCCAYHKTWTKQSCNSKTHQFNCDDAILIQSAIREGLGVSVIPCFTGDADPLLERYCDPESKFDLGLWVLMHPELKHNARVLAFRNHMIMTINEQRHLFEGSID